MPPLVLLLAFQSTSFWHVDNIGQLLGLIGPVVAAAGILLGILKTYGKSREEHGENIARLEAMQKLAEQTAAEVSDHEHMLRDLNRIAGATEKMLDDMTRRISKVEEELRDVRRRTPPLY